jgi:MMP 1-O-methyltransferase
VRRQLNRVLARWGWEIQRPRGTAAAGIAAGTPGLRACFDRTEGMIAFEEAQVLYELARTVRDGCIVEVGSYRGRSTVALGRGSLDGHGVAVFAVDPHEEFVGVLGGRFGPADRRAFYRAMLDSDCDRVVRLVNLSSEWVTPGWDRKVGLLWIDGDHRYAAVKRDYESWLPHLTPDAPVAFDDSVDPQIGPRQLIDELVAAGRVEEVRRVGKVTVVRRMPG